MEGEAQKLLDGEVDETGTTDMRSPMRVVNEVLREAEGIMADTGAFSRRPSCSHEQVLVDQVDFEYSPVKRREQPIEIVVRHNKIVSHNRSSDDSSDSDREKETMQTILEDQECTHQKRPSRKMFKKGHRRAWSMPSKNGEQSHIHVIHDQTQENDGIHTRRIVRYRMHPHKRRMEGGGAPAQFDVRLSDDDNELEVDINEEQIVYPTEEEKGRRTVVKRFWEARWKAQNFELLPEWLQDNEYLRTGHRPPLPSFGSCFKSIFALHTETGNIWTHMYGCVFFVGVALWFLTRGESTVQWMDKFIFSAFFLGAICCLGMSFAFHTVQCHSAGVGKLFSKLDYTGITLLIVGSFVPWIYYGFYCRPQPMLIYVSMILLLGFAAMVVSLWDKFAEPKFRPVRAGVFVAMGLSSIFPAIHLMITDGLMCMFHESSLHWLLLMGAFYLVGAAIYATRIPERFFPGKCDLWFQSHQLFHSFVVVAATIHLHGITEMAMGTLMDGSCPEQLLRKHDSEQNYGALATWLGIAEPLDTVSWSPSMVK